MTEQHKHEFVAEEQEDGSSIGVCISCGMKISAIARKAIFDTRSVTNVEEKDVMEEAISPRADMLREAERIGDRNVQYGDPLDDFKRTAAMWGAYLGFEMEPHDVAAMMAILKISRIRWSPEKRDSWVDLAGYAACGWHCVAPQEETEGVEDIPLVDHPCEKRWVIDGEPIHSCILNSDHFAETSAGYIGQIHQCGCGAKISFGSQVNWELAQIGDK